MNEAPAHPGAPAVVAAVDKAATTTALPPPRTDLDTFLHRTLSRVSPSLAVHSTFLAGCITAIMSVIFAVYDPVIGAGLRAWKRGMGWIAGLIAAWATFVTTTLHRGLAAAVWLATLFVAPIEAGLCGLTKRFEGSVVGRAASALLRLVETYTAAVQSVASVCTSGIALIGSGIRVGSLVLNTVGDVEGLVARLAEAIKQRLGGSTARTDTSVAMVGGGVHDCHTGTGTRTTISRILGSIPGVGAVTGVVDKGLDAAGLGSVDSLVSTVGANVADFGSAISDAVNSVLD